MRNSPNACVIAAVSPGRRSPPNRTRSGRVGMRQIVNPATARRRALASPRLVREVIGGAHRAELFVISGPRGVGKTTLALNLARVTASTGCGVLYVSPDPTRQLGIVERLLAAEASLPVDAIRRDRLGSVDSARRRDLGVASARLAHLPLYLDCRASFDIRALALRAVRLHRRRAPLGLVIIDDFFAFAAYEAVGLAPGRSGNAMVMSVLKHLVSELQAQVAIVAPSSGWQLRPSDHRFDRHTDVVVDVLPPDRGRATTDIAPEMTLQVTRGSRQRQLRFGYLPERALVTDLPRVDDPA